MELTVYGEYCLRAWQGGYADEYALKLRVNAGKLTQEEYDYIILQPK